MTGSDRIAIVGIGGLFPGAGDLAAFWSNVLGAVDASTDPPPGRWPIDPARVLDARPVAPDRVPSLKGYYLPEFTADLTGMDLATWPVVELDRVFHLALHIGNAAWRSAKTDRVDRSRCGVVLGNIALPTEKSNAIAREILGPKLGLFNDPPTTNALNRHTTGMPAALVAQGLSFGLGGYALDAACASSLYALKLACDELLAGRADAMIAGGLVRPDSLYTQMGFAQLRALSPTGRCAPFDERADGLVVGEGGCAFVLKRVADAVDHGDHIHGIIAGIGLSNDIEGNVLQPAGEGQLRALRAAYRNAGWRPSDVQLIECHATGTPTGDAVEFDSLRKLWEGQEGSCVLGGVKSTVGHLLTGAGAAALAKVLLAIREKTLPPTANFERPSSKLSYAGGPFRILRKPETWNSEGPRRAAINGFGFGGINAHVLVEEWMGESGRVSAGSRDLPALTRPGSHDAIAIVGLASRTASPIDSLELSVARFRIPPKELEEMLPQQTLMLQMAADAIDDTVSKPSSNLATGVFVGVSLDANTTNYHLRWMAGEIDEALKDEVCPALTANRTMGSLASIAASRVARFRGAGGPSFAVCDEEAGGLRAVQLAVGTLSRREIDRAVVGAVEFGCDPRYGATQDGAAALVLKRLDDAIRDGDRVYALIDRVESARIVNEHRPPCGAASGLLDLVRTSCELHEKRASINGRDAFWIHDSASGPRTATVSAGNVGRYRVHVEVRESSASEPSPQIAGRTEGLFLLTGDSPAESLAELSALGALGDGDASLTAKRWWHSRKERPAKARGLAFVASTRDEFKRVSTLAERHLRERPDSRASEDFFYSPTPLKGDVAFVYPGSGNHFVDMGRELGLAFPHILHRQSLENQSLASQYHARQIWAKTSLDGLAPKELIFAQVALGTLVSDLLASFGVRPNAVIPYSLGESAGLYGTRAWRDRDEMFRRMNESSLFATDLAGPCEAARETWKLAPDAKVDWLTGTIAASADAVRAEIRAGERVYIQIVNTARDCVIGGNRTHVEELVRRVGASSHEVRGVSTAHCEVAAAVREPYRQLHLLPTFPPEGVRYYSGAWGRAYELTETSAADAITAAAMDTIDFPRVVNAAYADGARIFVEIGPGSSCTRMIGSILQGRPHFARAACVPRQDEVSVFLRLLASLHTEGISVDLSVLYAQEEPIASSRSGPTITLPVGYYPKRVVRVDATPDVVIHAPTVRDPIATSNVNPVAILADVQTANVAAHDAFLRFSTAVQQQFARVVAEQTAQLQQFVAGRADVPMVRRTDGEVPRSLNFEECMEFARGLVGNVLGPRFAEIDGFPTRVRLPDGPLQLVDRVVSIEGQPLSMTNGRVVTEHLVHAERWYLENNRIPGCIAIEAGQADLFLSGFLGIDFKTRGLGCYRLLDAAVTFHRELPEVGELIRYDIRIDHFFRQGDTYLFRFQFEGSIDGEPLLTMRDGVAGFFTAADLAAGKGVIHTALDLKPIPGIVPPGWTPHVPLRDEALTDAQVAALRSGDLVSAFGAAFSAASLKSPMRLPGGMLELVHRVERIEPRGGRYGLGRIRCEADIHPDDWFLTCHFVDDQVMPGTLMYECCLHTLRVLLMRMGWVAEDGEARFEPLPGIASKLKCRGQVTATTRKVTYEVSLKEVGFGPEPYVICDALMYADGKPIVDISNMSLRMSGMTRERLDEIWAHRSTKPIFTRKQVVEFATGHPSKAFGDRYRPFDADRFIARLPAPPFSFIDRVTRVENCEPWKLVAGGSAEVEYEVPADAWYFAANRCDLMPYSVLNEVALQACGWMAAYLGSALTSPDDMHFRNLGGNCIQRAPVRPDTGKLTTRAKLTRVSPAAGMIILQFDFSVQSAAGPVYSGDTNFGFFTRASLANQVGLKDARMLTPVGNQAPRDVSSDSPFPDAMLRMVDTITHCSNDGGPKGLGMVAGRSRVNRDAWFFKAHFFQDPVWPGSLGLESLVQLLKVNAFERWGAPLAGWQAMVPGSKHRWAYRGQIVPTADEVCVQAYITQVDNDRRFLKADGLLAVDGRIIYQMNDFTVQG